MFFIGVSLFWQNSLGQKQVTLHMLVQSVEASQWRALIKEFEDEYPKISIEIVEGSDATNLIEKRYASVFERSKSYTNSTKKTDVSFEQSDPLYDLVYLDIIWVSRFASKGWLMDLSKEFSLEELKEFLPRDLDAGRHEKGLYRIPFHADVGVLYYRKDLLDKAKLSAPKTFDELKKISLTLQKQGTGWGYVWQGQQYEGLVAMFIEVLQGYNGFWIEPGTFKVGLDRDEAINAIKFLRSTIEEKISPPQVISYQEEETRSLFQSGEVVFLRNWPYVWSLANKPNSPVQGKFKLKPMVHVLNYPSGACLGGWGLGIAEASQYKKEALQALRFFTSDDIQLKYSLATGNMPSRRSLFHNPMLVERYSYYPTLLEVLENNAVLRPAIPEYNEASRILQKYLSIVLAKSKKITDKEIKGAMQTAATETRMLLLKPK